MVAKWCLAVGALLLLSATPVPCQSNCGGNHLCSGYAWYPTDVDNTFGAVFDVPALPSNATAYLELTYYIYFNIFFHNYEPQGGVYNQFVPQLMLGQALSNSTGPPLYNPLWGNYSSYVFSAQYFFDIIDPATNTSVPKAVTGNVYPCEPGELLWTRMTQSAAREWTLEMGVVGDAARTSSVVAPRPFMGLLPGTTSWAEETYRNVHFNSCWELYSDVWDRSHWPGSGSTFRMHVRTGQPGSVVWATNWTNGDAMPCPGHPNTTTVEAHTAAEQNVTWTLFY